jgi:hypothetical protein
METKLADWVMSCNKDGLTVKDRYIVNQAVLISEQLKEESVEYEDFKASKGWLSAFKNRHTLVSRRQTSTRVVPNDAREKSFEFIREVQKLIKEKGILPKNILNADQVPRYYEKEASSTITPRGTKNVFLRKASSNHKRLTATFLINADGKLLHTHVLLTKLQKVPADIKMTPSLRVQVNSTGMWSGAILDDYMKNVILKRPETQLLKQPVLLVIDSFSPHVALANSKKYEKNNIFIVIVPPSMTNLLQPLDVVVNKSFQSAYNNKYDDYIRIANSSQQNRTKANNIKTPTHKMSIDWIVDWATHVDENMIKKSFDVCGIVSEDSFDIEKLHGPLKLLICDDFDEFMWNTENGSLLTPDNQLEINEENFFHADNEETSFYEAIHSLKDNTEDEKSDFLEWMTDYAAIIKQFIIEKWNINLDEDDSRALDAGNMLGTKLDIHAVASIENVEIEIDEVDEESRIIETCILNKSDEYRKKLYFICSNGYYLLKIKE